MNVDDVKIDYEQYKGLDLLDVIYQKQENLMSLYKVPKIDLDIPSDQQLIRAMAWSVVEEAGEAMEVYEGSKHKGHLGDEIADMTHFYFELLIMSGITCEQIKECGVVFKTYDTSAAFKDFVVRLSLAVNTLKNRFWRMTNLKTDKAKYHERLIMTIESFFRFVNSTGIKTDEFFDFYLRKNEVNLFRIRSKY